ncbi:MAG: DoxX family protein [Chthoniobacterales bacterium]
MQFLAKYRETGLLLMRLGLGVLFIILAGPVLLSGMRGWANFGSAVHNLGVHTHYAFWGFLGALMGCVGGALMVFGLFFRPGVILVLIITLVHLLGALGGVGTLRANLAAVELALILFGLLFVGPGKYSVDKN